MLYHYNGYLSSAYQAQALAPCRQEQAHRPKKDEQLPKGYTRAEGCLGTKGRLEGWERAVESSGTRFPSYLPSLWRARLASKSAPARGC